MEEAEARERLGLARVGHLATISVDGRPDVVPFCFAVDGDVLYTAIDHKPKSTVRLQRLANIESRPDVTVVVDAYDEDWSQLWWIRVRGRARITEGQGRQTGLELLVEKYQQYRERPPEGPVIAIRLLRWRWWSAWS